MEFDRFDILTRPRKTSKAQSEITKSKLQQDSRSALIANGQPQEKQSLHFNVSEAKNENQDKQNQQEQQHEQQSEHNENEKTDENQNQQSQKGTQKSKSFFGKIKQKWLQKDQKQKNPVNQQQNQQNESKNMQAQNDSSVIKEYEQLVINNNNKNKKYSEENQLEHRQSKVSENGSYLASGLREEQNSKTNLDNCSSFLDKMEKNFKSRRDKIKFQKFYDDLKNIIEDENNIEDISIQTMNQVNKLLLANPEFIEYFVDQCLNPVDSSDPIKKKGQTSNFDEQQKMGEMLMSNPDNSLSPTSPVNQTKLSDPDNGEFQLIQDDGDFFDPDNTSSQNDPSLITQEDFENKYMDENRFIELSKQQEKEEKMSLKNNQSALKPLTSIKRPSFFGKDLQELYKDLRTGSEDKTTDSSSLQSYKTQKLQINDLQEENEDDEEEQEEQQKQKEQNQKKEENKQIQKQIINKDQQNNYENQGEENQEQQKQSQQNSQQNYEICDENNYSYLSSSNSQSNQDIISFSLNSDLNNKSRNKSQLQNRNSGKSDDFKKNNNNNNGGTFKEDPISEKKAKEEEDQEQENEEISSIDKKNNCQQNNVNTQNFGQKNIKDKEKSTDKSDDIENELEQLDIDDPENNIEFNITNSQEEIKKKQLQDQDQSQDQDQNQKQNQQKQQQQLENEQQNENEEDEIGNCELDENGLPILKIIDTKYIKQQKQKKKQQNQQLMKQNQQSGRKQNQMELTLSYELNSDSENDANNNDLRSDSSQECSPLGANEKNEQYFQGQIKQQNNQNSNNQKNNQNNKTQNQNYNQQSEEINSYKRSYEDFQVIKE